MPNSLLWLDGRFSPVSEGFVSVEDRGLNFADGIYEVIRVYDGMMFMADDHLDRWDRSAAGILLDDPRSRDERLAVLAELLDRSGLREATLYGQLSRGAATRTHVFPDSSTPTEFWIARPAPVYPDAWRTGGIALASHPDDRWAYCCYKTIALLPNCLAKERARRAGAQEALLYKEDGKVTECSASNAFCVLDGVLRTHPCTRAILPGITRAPVLEIAASMGLEVREEAVTLDEFRSAEEAFLSSTTMEIMPVTRLDGEALGGGAVGPWTQRLMEALRAHIAEAAAAARAA